MFNIIPAIDILEGNLVRLTKGNYQKIKTYAKTPSEIAKTYSEYGAKRIHIVDLDGARDGKLVNKDVIKKIRMSTKAELEFGGGVRSKETINELFDLGIDYVIIGSLLVKNPLLAFEIIDSFPGKIIAGIDAKADLVATEGWLNMSMISIFELINKLEQKPIAAIIYTDINRDGTLTGPNLESLTKVAKSTKKPIIASGGISSLEDIENIKKITKLGIEGCILGKAILSEKIDISKLWLKS